MDLWRSCATCGVENDSDVDLCLICADERQYLPRGGQRWTTSAERAGEGCRIEIEVRLTAGRCSLRVVDTGVGLRKTDQTPGTGLSTLRERLDLAFGGDARLALSPIEPHGVCAEIDLPIRREPQ